MEGKKWVAFSNEALLSTCPKPGEANTAAIAAHLTDSKKPPQ